jgi:hypothetical protein
LRKPIKITLLLVLTLGLGGAAWVALRPPPSPPPVRLHPTAHQFDQAEKRLTEAGQAVSIPRTSSRTRLAASPRTLRLSESDLNVYLAGSPTARKILAAHGVTAVQIVLREPAEVIVHAAVVIHGHAQNIELRGTLTPDPKVGLHFTASGARVGRWPLPAPVVTAEANALAARFLRRLPMKVQTVCVQKQDLVIVGLPITASPQSKSPARR